MSRASTDRLIPKTPRRSGRGERLQPGPRDLQAIPPNAQVGVGLDADRFWDLIVAAVAALG